MAAAAALRSVPRSGRLPSALPELIQMHGMRTATPLTVRDLYNHGADARRSPGEARLASARWLHRELPIRLAHRVRELEELPLGLANMPSVEEVREMYQRSFAEIVSTPEPEVTSDDDKFAELLSCIRKRHESVVKLVARGVLELKESHGQCASHYGIRSFLDSFYMSRIGIRVLISHHLSLRENHKDMYGIINHKCTPALLAQDAINATRSLAYQHYGEAPDVYVMGNTGLHFPYVDSHMFLCLFELLKNSLRATIETHRDADKLPPVRLIIADGVEDVTIKISDEGGGFRRSEMDRVWTYLFTTANLSAQQLLESEDRSAHCNRPDPIAGFGYGLPLSRLYARYWGGELSLTSMEGYGTDAYLHLSKLGNKRECLSGLKRTPTSTRRKAVRNL